MSEGGTILVVDDDRGMCELIAADVAQRGFRAHFETDGEGALAALGTQDFDLVLTDIRMPGGISGIELCQQIVDRRPDIPVVVMTAFGSLDAAVAAIRAGAYDFVSKPVELDVLEITLRRAIEHRDLQQKVRALGDAVRRAVRFDELIGESPPMLELYRQLDRIADSDASVLITGESGTGKELVARALHRRGPRSGGPFVAVNVAALPEALLESELFGHVRGAFTGAAGERKGLIVEAEGGTLFLDELGELPLALQPKLLRSLEEHAVRPVGGDREQQIDVRVIAATNLDLEAAVADGRFRDDLYYRIAVLPIALPPLRTRGTDVLLLAGRSLEQSATRSGKPVTGITRAAAECLLAYRWPGNVRELRNAIERAVALTEHDRIVPEDLPERIRSPRQSEERWTDLRDASSLVPLAEIERRYILHVLEAVGGHRTAAASILGLDRKTLYRKLLAYEADSKRR